MIIMKLVCLRIIAVLAKIGSASVSQLAEKTGFAISSVSEGVKELEDKSIVARENGKVAMAPTPVAQEFIALSSKFDPEKLLKDTRETIVLGLIEPKTTVELEKAIGISGVQLSRLLRDLFSVGAVFRDGEKLVLNGSVKKFALELKKVINLKGLEPNATLLFSNSVRLKKLPLGAKAKGTLTGFSRFAEHGVEYAAVSDFFAEPGREVSVEEILVHALVASENKKDLAMCLVFYWKNSDKMELRKLMELAKEFKVLGLFLDCIAYLDKRQVKDNSLFLPWSEFNAIAADYGMVHSVKQKFSAQELEALFTEIGKTLQGPLKVFLIGGCNLALKGIKAATKDIDLVVKDKNDFEKIQKTLHELGFGPLARQETSYRKMEPSEIFVLFGKPRVDVFTRIVCNALTLSESMVDRSIEKKYGSLSVNFVKPEDIILFKAITDRDGDLDDIAAIIRRESPDWKFFLSELGRQHDKSERLFCLDVLDTMELLEKMESIVIPVKQKLVNLCLEKGILYLAGKPVSVKEIMKKMDFPELTIRNKISQLVKNKKLAKLKGKPFKVQAAKAR